MNNDTQQNDRQSKSGITEKLTDLKDDLKDEFGNLIKDTELQTWLETIKKEAGDSIEMLSRKARGVFNPNRVVMELDDIQSIILRDRPTPYYGTLVAIKINDAQIGRNMLAEFINDVSDAENWHKDMDATLNIVMTYDGLKALGVPQDSLDTFPESFKAGMAGRADRLKDTGVNAPENWQAPFGDKGDIHICAAVIADSEQNGKPNLTNSKTTSTRTSTLTPLATATSKSYSSITLAQTMQSKTSLVTVAASVTPKSTAVASKPRPASCKKASPLANLNSVTKANLKPSPPCHSPKSSAKTASTWSYVPTTATSPNSTNT